MTWGFGIVPGFPRFVVVDLLSSSRTSWHRSMHWAQMYTPGPATSFRTCSWPLPQNEQRVCRRRSSHSVTAFPLDWFEFLPRPADHAFTRALLSRHPPVVSLPRAELRVDVHRCCSLRLALHRS